MPSAVFPCFALRRIELASSAGFPSLLDPSSGYTGGSGSAHGLTLPPPMSAKPGWNTGSSFPAAVRTPLSHWGRKARSLWVGVVHDAARAPHRAMGGLSGTGHLHGRGTGRWRARVCTNQSTRQAATAAPGAASCTTPGRSTTTPRSRAQLSQRPGQSDRTRRQHTSRLKARCRMP